MRHLSVFNTVSLDGYYTDLHNDMQWAQTAPDDTEWNEFVGQNAEGGDTLLFGRVTWQLMSQFWPTPMAAQMMPEVAARMNAMRKVVVSHAPLTVPWENSERLAGDLVAGVRALKDTPGRDITILGSGSIVAPLLQAGLIDSVQVVVTPVVLGGGKSMFAGVEGRPGLQLQSSRAFRNGRVVLSYTRA